MIVLPRRDAADRHAERALARSQTPHHDPADGALPVWADEWHRAFDRGDDVTTRRLPRWCAEVGFARCEIVPLAGPTSAAVAFKAA